MSDGRPAGADPAGARRPSAVLEQAWRRERRAFVLDHHPDRGGDAEAFRLGLAALDARRPGPARTPSAPTAYRRLRGLELLRDRTLGAWSRRRTPPPPRVR